jgi:hypothetical protein
MLNHSKLNGKMLRGMGRQTFTFKPSYFRNFSLNRFQTKIKMKVAKNKTSLTLSGNSLPTQSYQKEDLSQPQLHR